MNSYNRIFQVALLVLITSMFLYTIFRTQPKQHYPISSTKTITRNINSKKEDVLSLLKQVAADRQVISSIYAQLKSLKSNLAQAKKQKDTVQIIQIQDRVIAKQDTVIKQHQKMDFTKDSVILAQEYIIDSQDTIIKVKTQDYKRVRRQRNLSVLLNAVLAGLLFVK